MIEKPYGGRAKIEFDGIKLKISIPSKKNWFIIIFLTAWMGGWFMGETSAINQLFKNGNFIIDGFMIFWLVGWTIGGIFAISILIWSLFGMETIKAEGGVLRVSKGILDVEILKKNYELNSIKNLELDPNSSSLIDFFGQKKKVSEFLGMIGGKLRFDYGLKTIRFGIGIDEAEARYLIEEFKKKGFYKES